MIEIREAGLKDYDLLQEFYFEAYRAGHPLQNVDFFEWQFGNSNLSKVLIATDENKIVAHLGCVFSDGFTWLINLYILEKYRQGTLVLALYSRAKALGNPLITTNANSAVVQLYRRMRWYRYPNLERYCIVNPAFSGGDTKSLWEAIFVDKEFKAPDGHRYWQQPGQMGFLTSGGGSGILHPDCGGARLVNPGKISDDVRELFEAGFKWIDYVTSWNDPVIDQLGAGNWVPEREAAIPWLLDPVIVDSRSEITVFSNIVLPRDLIIRRYHSDHGRVPSIKN